MDSGDEDKSKQAMSLERWTIQPVQDSAIYDSEIDIHQPWKASVRG